MEVLRTLTANHPVNADARGRAVPCFAHIGVTHIGVHIGVTH